MKNSMISPFITVTIAKTMNRDLSSFCHPVLTEDEIRNGCRLGFDTWADTSCSGKHAYVEAFVEGKMVTATGFSSTLGQLENLHVAHVVYAHDLNDGSVILLENNNTIYMGENMEDSLINPIQCEDNMVHVDTRPAKYYPNEVSCQSLTFADGYQIPIQYDGVLPYIHVRKPTPTELDTCERRSLTSVHDWNPDKMNTFFAPINNKLYVPSNDPINDELQCKNLSKELEMEQLLLPHEIDNAFIYATSLHQKVAITPEELSAKWHIGLKTAERTLKATTYKCTRTTGLMSKRFKTDKAQLQYNQLSRHNGVFYVDYLKSGVKSI